MTVRSLPWGWSSAGEFARRINELMQHLTSSCCPAMRLHSVAALPLGAGRVQPAVWGCFQQPSLFLPLDNPRADLALERRADGSTLAAVGNTGHRSVKCFLQRSSEAAQVPTTVSRVRLAAVAKTLDAGASNVFMAAPPHNLDAERLWLPPAHEKCVPTRRASCATAGPQRKRPGATYPTMNRASPGAPMLRTRNPKAG
jgi:hypothetical protein